MGFVRNRPLNVEQGTIVAGRYSVEPSGLKPEIEVDSANRFERRGVDQLHNARSAGCENHISGILSYERRADQQSSYCRNSKHGHSPQRTKLLTTRILVSSGLRQRAGVLDRFGETK